MSKNNYTVSVRRVARSGNAAISTGITSAGAPEVTAAELASVKAEVLRLSGMWKEDPERQGTIYTPYNAYAVGGVSALGVSPDMPDATPDAGSVELLTDWADDPDGKALGADLGKELRADMIDAVNRVETAESTVKRTVARVEGVHRNPDRHLRRGIIPLTAAPGEVYRNLGFARMRLPAKACTVNINLANYFAADIAAALNVTLGASHPTEGCTANADGSLSVPAGNASFTRDGAQVCVTISNPVTTLGRPSAVLLVITLPEGGGPFVQRAADGKIIFTPHAGPLHEVRPPMPTSKEIKTAFSNKNFRGYELQRRHRHFMPAKEQHFPAWVHLRRPDAKLPHTGVFRIRRRTHRHRYTSAWVYVSWCRGRLKILTRG